MESIDGTLERILYHKPNRFNPAGAPYLIGRLQSGKTVKGQIRNPVAGEEYRFFGEWKDQKGYDQAFEFSAYEPILPRAGSGLASALSVHVAGLGPAKSAAIVDELGEDTLAVLRSDPERILSIRGITPAIVDNIKTWLADHASYDPAAYAALSDLFAGHKVPRRVVESLLKHWGSDAPGLVRENPYILMAYPRVGWKTADAIALTACSYPSDGLARHQAACLEALERIAGEGHTVATLTEVATQAEALLGVTLDDAAIPGLIDDGDVIPYEDEHGTVYQLSSLADAEAEIAERLAVLMASKPSAEIPDGWLGPDWAAEAGLGEDQAEAARLIESNPVVAITGAPGTGKTYTLSRSLGRIVECEIGGIRVCAPTGKAAKRASELLQQVEGLAGVPCSTIHRALAPSPNTGDEGVPAKEAKFRRGREEFGFAKSENSPLDDQIIVIDETSMVDVRLMASFLRAVKPGTRLIIVGDPNQLPSVGPGSVLRDILAAGVPHVELRQIRRSDGGGRVVRACHAIKDGKVPQPAETIALPTENWIHIELSDPHEIAAKIVGINSELAALGADAKWDVQAVSAQNNRHEFACFPLNARLTRWLNPDRGCMSAEDAERLGFAPGDKVVRTANGVADELRESDGFEGSDFTWGGSEWKAVPCPIVNGDMGEVLDVVAEGQKTGVIVRFRDPDRLCRLPLGDHKLIMAYAMTVHKCQGSGFPFVVVPVHHAFYWDSKKNTGLFSRELLYTAISRAERLLVTVGQWSAVIAAVGRKTIHQRQTTLAERLRLAREGVAGVPF